MHMPWVGFEPMIPVFERAKTFHVLDRMAPVIGINLYRVTQIVTCIIIQNSYCLTFSSFMHSLFDCCTTTQLWHCDLLPSLAWAQLTILSTHCFLSSSAHMPMLSCNLTLTKTVLWKISQLRLIGTVFGKLFIDSQVTSGFGSPRNSLEAEGGSLNVLMEWVTHHAGQAMQKLLPPCACTQFLC
jgi:hypothetical protein